MLYKGEAVITSDYGFYSEFSSKMKTTTSPLFVGFFNDFVTNLKNSEQEKCKITIEKILEYEELDFKEMFRYLDDHIRCLEDVQFTDHNILRGHTNGIVLKSKDRNEGLFIPHLRMADGEGIELNAYGYIEDVEQLESFGENMINAVVLKPNCDSYYTYIENSYNGFSDEINGRMKVLTLEGQNNVAYICNENYDMDTNLKLNRLLKNKDKICEVIYGNCVIVGDDGNKFVSLEESRIKNLVYLYSDERSSMEISNYFENKVQQIRSETYNMFEKRGIKTFDLIDELRNKLDLVDGDEQELNNEVYNISSRFNIDFAYSSNALEGNSIDITEATKLLENGETIGDKNLSEVLDIVNHAEAYKYILNIYRTAGGMDKGYVKKINEIMLSNNPKVSGKYMFDNSEIQLRNLLDTYVDELKYNDQHDLENIAELYLDFAKLKPFKEANGQTNRLLLNFELLRNNYMPINIEPVEKERYENCISEYIKNGRSDLMADFIKQKVELEYKIHFCEGEEQVQGEELEQGVPENELTMD